MLELRPSCEHCGCKLPPDSNDAMICSFECTFCRSCVDGVLENVCPNCGGGFSSRPVRPRNNWKNEAYLGKHPAADKHTHKPVDVERHKLFAADIKDIPPQQR